MKIGILTQNFIELIGARDFLVQLLQGLSSIATEKSLDIYILIHEPKAYRQYSGLKRLYKKFLYSRKHYVLAKSHELFPLFNEKKNITFVYHTQDVPSVAKSLELDFILPHLELNYDRLPTPSLGYLYDCQHKYLPEFFTLEVIKARDDFFSEMVKQPLVVNSRDTKNDYIKFYNAKPENIYALPFTPKLNEEYLENHSNEVIKYNLPKKYFLSSNQFWVHKDHTTLFKAFAKFIEKPQYSDYQLVCTGTMEDSRKPDYIETLTKLIQELGIENQVKLLGLIPKHEQVEVMKNCVAVIQTTLFEGGPGGGSVWDALSLGVPAIVSDIPVNLEIEDELVTFFITSNVEDLVKKMKELDIKGCKTFSFDELKERSDANARKLGLFVYDAMQEVIARKQNKR